MKCSFFAAPGGHVQARCANSWPWAGPLMAIALVSGVANAQVQPGPSAQPPSIPAMAQPAPMVPLSLAETNPFDPERKVWPDRVPPPPPVAPPPAPPAVTDEDMQVYGVIITGEGKRATVRVGKRFAHLAPAGRAFATVTEGQTLGEFILSAVRPDHLVLFAPGGEQRLYFTAKTDRAAGQSAVVAAAPAPVQGATNPQADAGAAGGGAASPSGAPPGAANGVQQQTPPAAAAAAPSAPAQAAQPFNLRNSLAAALEAARNNTPQAVGNNPAAAAANPFQKP